MIFSKNNHIKYWYNNDRSRIFRNVWYDILSFEVGGITRPIKSFREECAIAAGELIEKYPDLHIGLTAGLDSNTCLYSFLDIGIKPGVFIVRFAENLNDFDVNHAINQCQKLNISPIIVDIDIKKFIKNDMLDICKEYQVYSMYQAMLMYACKNFNFSFITVDEIELRRDIHPNGSWCFIKKEDQDMSWRRYAFKTNIKALNNFFTWSPELMLSFLNLPIVEDLCNNKFVGKLSWNNLKNQIYSYGGFPEVEKLKKTYGIEKFMNTFETVGFDIEKFYLINNNFRPIDCYVEYNKIKKDLSQDGNCYQYVI